MSAHSPIPAPVLYIFSTGLTRTGLHVKNDLITGKSGGQTIVGGTATGQALQITSNLINDGPINFLGTGGTSMAILGNGHLVISGVDYTWPLTVAAADDYVLTSTTGGVLTWAAAALPTVGGPALIWASGRETCVSDLTRILGGFFLNKADYTGSVFKLRFSAAHGGGVVGGTVVLYNVTDSSTVVSVAVPVGNTSPTKYESDLTLPSGDKFYELRVSLNAVAENNQDLVDIYSAEIRVSI